MIDPIIPLAVTLVEAPGSMVYFLGAGISAAAGIPTGGEVRWRAVRDLFTLLHNRQPDSEAEVSHWFEDSPYRTYTYSAILAELRPAIEERRKYLEKYFVGKQPTTAHHAIARQVKRGLVRVILTTNFDPLMEKVLEEEGVPFDVVAAAQDLDQVRPREHSPCRIVKLHGDWRRCNLRNTEDELRELDGPLATEFQEILDRYGIIVLGYGGGDEDFRSHVERRKSRYTIYWVGKNTVPDWVTYILRQQDGRLILCDTADSFLSELDLKIAAFSTAPSGETPEIVIRETEERLRTGDLIGLRSDAERHIRPLIDLFEEACANQEPIRRNERLITDELIEVAKPLIAFGYTLIKHGRTDAFEICLKSAQTLLNVCRRTQTQCSSYVAELPLLVVYGLTMTWGMYCLASGSYKVLHELAHRRWIVPYSGWDYHVALWEGTRHFQHPDIFGRSAVAGFDWTCKMALAQDFLWQEFMYTKNKHLEPAVAMDILLSFLNIALGAVDTWRWYPNFARFEDEQISFLRRLQQDPEFVKGLAGVLNETPEAFRSRWNERMDACAQKRQSPALYFHPWEAGA